LRADACQSGQTLQRLNLAIVADSVKKSVPNVPFSPALSAVFFFFLMVNRSFLLPDLSLLPPPIEFRNQSNRKFVSFQEQGPYFNDGGAKSIPKFHPMLDGGLFDALVALSSLARNHLTPTNAIVFQKKSHRPPSLFSMQKLIQNSVPNSRVVKPFPIPLIYCSFSLFITEKVYKPIVRQRRFKSAVAANSRKKMNSGNARALPSAVGIRR
jgi:hypothetical protein